MNRAFSTKTSSRNNYLTEGWQSRVFQQFSGKYSARFFLFYINHLDWELTKSGSGIYAGGVRPQ